MICHRLSRQASSFFPTQTRRFYKASTRSRTNNEALDSTGQRSVAHIKIEWTHHAGNAVICSFFWSFLALVRTVRVLDRLGPSWKRFGRQAGPQTDWGQAGATCLPRPSQRTQNQSLKKKNTPKHCFFTKHHVRAAAAMRIGHFPFYGARWSPACVNGVKPHFKVKRFFLETSCQWSSRDENRANHPSIFY